MDRQQVVERVIAAVKKHEKADPNKVSASSHLINDLGLDSLDATEVFYNKK
ncbi:MAG: acyl carrier protein [Pseudobdellovibrio sp.]